MEMVKLLGYAPDIDPTTPGVLTGGCFEPAFTGVRSTGRWFERPSGGTSGTVNSPPFPVLGSGFGETLWSTSTELRRSASLVASIPSNSGFTFVQSGPNVLVGDLRGNQPPILLTNYGVTTTAFSATPAGFSGRIVAETENFFFLFSNVTDPDRWYCSALGNVLDWVPSVTTQANTGTLRSQGGAITAAMGLGDRMIAYKEEEIWVGSYVGSPEVWRWERTPGFGCVGPRAVCTTGNFHVVLGNNDIYLFDGVRPVSIAAGAVQQELIRNRALRAGAEKIVVYDDETKNVYIQFDRTSSLPIWVYNINSKMWGTVNLASGVAGLIGSAPSADFNSVRKVPAFVRTNYVIYARERTGASANPELAVFAPMQVRSHLMGDSTIKVHSREFRWRLPVGGQVTSVVGDSLYSPQNLSAAPLDTVTRSVGSGDEKADIRLSGNWLRYTMSLSIPASPGLVEITHYGASLGPAGKR